ncbi:ribosomal RNA small subunit methyltransferase I [Thiosulfatimonas sediminis]|uniref:Ribosomal RNA small subunit methyltransferase I n=1 Tax=Thiosulfatimonas sediminis TaxID=2675054 RepID=A0A6F8PX47_9GAMM|nr:16S rRNA (cytidine(1402)-2'-O)-methyltransferase [Thiosulfatimonas sediminis]BBP46568.1 ribosomal RNA small subunit methyltransferase I [Thiosulfatimonas sediminis]
MLINSDQRQPGSGILYVVATPIGNLADISQRALETLASVDWIAAEDTRHTKPLLQHFAIQQTLFSLHEHNEAERSEQLLVKLLAGENGALVSDAGTPLINDPGFVLVKKLRQAGVAVVPIPGPSAVITALSAAGLPTDSFRYMGFLPARSNKRKLELQALLETTATLVFYESPHRVLDTLSDLLEVFGAERELAVARELTKQYEQFVSGSLQEVNEFFQANSGKVRGEFVLMLQGAQLQQEERASSEFDPWINAMLQQNLPVKQISEVISLALSVKKKQVYQRVLELKDAAFE